MKIRRERERREEESEKIGRDKVTKKDKKSVDKTEKT